MQYSRSIRNWRLIAAALQFLVLVGLPDRAGAQTGITNIINGITVTTNGPYLVGLSGPRNALIITNAGKLFSQSGVVGQSGLANSNNVWITGSNSIWSNDAGLVVGDTGFVNRLFVLAGASLHSSTGTIGRWMTTLGNQVVVDGTNSFWTNTTEIFVGDNASQNRLTISGGGRVQTERITVGALGSFNTTLVVGASSQLLLGNFLLVGSGNNQGNILIVSNGGFVQSAYGEIGTGVAGSNNAVLVTGAGSHWTNTIRCAVGMFSPGNWMTISDGGRVDTPIGYMGYGSAAVRNSATVTGTGSVWTTTNSINVGYSAGSNRLFISNGGKVDNASGVVGDRTNAGWNLVEVNGNGSQWTNFGFFYVGRTASYNRLVITNGGRVENTTAILGDFRSSRGNTAMITGPDSTWRCVTGALLAGRFGTENQVWLMDQGKISANATILGREISSQSNLVVISGAGSLWSNHFNVLVGDNGPHNRMYITNGGTMFNASGTLGWNNVATASNNFVEINGAGSTWLNTNELHVGYYGRDNTLIITNAGTVLAKYGYVGYWMGSIRNSAIVTGPNTTWSNRLEMWVGYRDAFANRLTLEEGARVYSGPGGVGDSSLSFNNIAVISGSGSRWIATNEFHVGKDGSFNRLVITNAGRLDSLHGYIGKSRYATNNSATIQGTGSLWNITGDLIVGDTGNFNRVNMLDGGRVNSGAAWVGFDLQGRGRYNTTLVSGVQSAWSNATWIIVGMDAQYNELIVTNGGSVFCGEGHLGYYTMGRHNAAHISGTGSLWRTYGNNFIGYGGDSNALIITDGGKVRNDYGTIGYWNGGGNSAVVSGVGSVWSNDQNLTVGDGSWGSSLSIFNGAKVYDNYGRVGGGTFSTNNRVVVDGIGSAWVNQDNLFVGIAGGMNTLIITNGGAVVNDDGYLGGGSFARHNLAIVSGVGSVWSNRLYQHIGWTSAQNRLVIEDGGRVYAALDAYVGTDAGGVSNSVLVTGTGSLWRAAQIIAGWTGRYNEVTLENGGRMSAVNSFVGSRNGATWNRVRVEDSGSVWSNASDLWIGYEGAFSSLVITNGGIVVHNIGGLGNWSTSSNNTAVISGAGSTLSNNFELAVGVNGLGNEMIVEQGGKVAGGAGYVGVWADMNFVHVRDAGSTWSNKNSLFVGYAGSANTLRVSDDALVSAILIVIGNQMPASGNILHVDKGHLRSANAAGEGRLEARYGTLQIDGGSVTANRLDATNGAAGQVVFSYGLVQSGGGAISNGAPFNVGDESDYATFELWGGVHTFADGLFVNKFGILMGTGTINGAVTFKSGSLLSPGASIGRITVNGPLTLDASGTVHLEIRASPHTNDMVDVSGTLTLAGTLIVSNLAGTLSNGDTFKLFNATNIVGSFSAITLPPLPAGLRWETGNLGVNGEISVFQLPEPDYAGIQFDGTNFVLVLDSFTGGIYALQSATNLLPPVSWFDLLTNTGTGSLMTNQLPADGLSPTKFFRTIAE